MHVVGEIIKAVEYEYFTKLLISAFKSSLKSFYALISLQSCHVCILHIHMYNKMFANSFWFCFEYFYSFFFFWGEFSYTHFTFLSNQHFQFKIVHICM